MQSLTNLHFIGQKRTILNISSKGPIYQSFLSVKGQQQITHLNLFRRLSSRSTKSSSTTSLHLKFPSRLLIFHAGTSRTVALAFIRLTTFLLSFSSILFIAPSLYIKPTTSSEPSAPLWLPPLVALGGSVPLLAVVILTRPFTSFVHLALPASARTSKQTLEKFIQNAPFTAELDLTTMRFLGGARVRRVPLGNLERIGNREKQFWQLENLKVARERTGRIMSVPSSAKNEGRPAWWQPKSVDRFFIGKNTVRKDQIMWWGSILRRIEKASDLGKIKSR